MLCAKSTSRGGGGGAHADTCVGTAVLVFVLDVASLSRGRRPCRLPLVLLLLLLLDPKLSSPLRVVLLLPAIVIVVVTLASPLLRLAAPALTP